MRHAIPLRYALPLGFLTLSAVLMTVSYVIRSREVAQRNESLMVQRAAGLGQLIASELEAGYKRGDAKASGPLFDRLHAVPHLTAALVCDEAGLILNATRDDLRGRRIASRSTHAAGHFHHGLQPGDRR